MSTVYCHLQGPTIVPSLLPNPVVISMDLESAGFQDVQKKVGHETSKRPPATSEAEAVFKMVDSENRGFVTLQV